MMYSIEHIKYLKRKKKTKIIVFLIQISILIIFFSTWQILADNNLINTFITSSPKRIMNSFINLYHNNLFRHIIITSYEVVISFILSMIIGIFISSLLWWNKMLARVLDPFLTILNSMPKVSLGPLLIIWFGAKTKSIIIMSLLISVFIVINNIYQGFINTDELKIKIFKSFKASKWQIYSKLVLPNSYQNILNVSKVNISMCLIGVIMGEFLVSKEGIGYLITYGCQVFNLDLVMAGIVILCIMASIIYYIINKIKK